MRPNKSLGRIKVFCNVEIWIFLVWIIPQQSSVLPPSKALVYRPPSLLWSLIGQMVTFTNAWPWVRSRVESYLTTPKAFAILAETSTVPGTETWVSTEKHSLLVKRIEAGCLCVMGENTQQLPRNSQERRLRGARSVLPSSIRQQLTTKLAFSQLSFFIQGEEGWRSNASWRRRRERPQLGTRSLPSGFSTESW